MTTEADWVSKRVGAYSVVCEVTDPSHALMIRLCAPAKLSQSAHHCGVCLRLAQVDKVGEGADPLCPQCLVIVARRLHHQKNLRVHCASVA